MLAPASRLGYARSRAQGGVQGKRRFAGDRYAAWLLPLPAALVTAVLIVFPIAFLLYMGFCQWFFESASTWRWVGLENYIALVTDSRFVGALWHTLYFAALGLVIQIPLGILIALLFHQEFPGRGLMRTLLLLPMVATPVAMALVWVMMLDPGMGVIRYLLGTIGVASPAWLSNPNTVIPTLVMVDSWEWTPLVALMCLSGLAALPTEPFEAALLDGASPWTRFWYLTLPMLRPTLVIAIVFRVIDLLKVVDIIYVMTRGGPGFSSETLNVYDFFVGLFYYQIGYGSAIAVVLFALVLGVTLLLMRVRRATW
ncbi:MAG: sugar ABC transporter permease [Rhodospirillales bacterium]|nr:sugar ABC transporter permease [Rhodospirillales bacterium]